MQSELMSDLFRQELDIPEKPRTFGWVLLGLGAVMVIIAVFIFLKDARELAGYQARQELKMPVTTTTSPYVLSTQEVIPHAARRKAEQLLAIVVVTVALLMTFIVFATINHRLARLFRPEPDRTRKKTTFIDPWEESGRRFQTPPDS